jgi:hypothetical protein
MILAGAEVIDEGQTACEELVQRFRTSDRSSVALQPALNLLEDSRDFPHDAPVLFLTSVPCDRIKTQRTHAYLIPDGGRLTYHSDATIIEITDES